MGTSVDCLFKTDSLRKQWEEWCPKILDQFNLPSSRLMCGFDDERSFWFDSLLRDLKNPDARALHLPTTAAPTPWPGFLERRRNNVKLPAPDSLIYIPLVTPTNVPFAFVATLAHELQHFVQCWTEPRVWEANGFFYDNLLLLDAEIPAYATWTIPIEHDAMVKSKRVAVSLFGEEIVQNELRSLVSRDKTTKEWEFLLGVSPSAGCNVCNETRQLAKTYEKGILALRSKWPSGIDFTKPDWCQWGNRGRTGNVPVLD